MVRILKFHIGTNDASQRGIELSLTTFWRHLKHFVAITVHVEKNQTLVAFDTNDSSLQLFEHVTEDIAGVDKVKSEELSQEHRLISNRSVKRMKTSKR